MAALALQTIVEEQLAKARAATAGRAAETISGDHARLMRQTVIALTAGTELSEHENPGEATIYVVAGAVEVAAGDERLSLRAGDFADVPAHRHSLHALEDSAVLLTAVHLPRS
jgi:quercetin dioxygenase-like cupin family protein